MFDFATARSVQVVLLLRLLLACTSPKESADAAQTTAEAIVVPIDVMSGRPQPSPTRTVVASGAPVVLHVEGLDTKVVIHAPGETRLSVKEMPLTKNRSVIGTEVRFVAQGPGTYRIEQAEAPGTVLAVLDVRA